MNRKIIIALCALCLCAFCSCSKNEEQNNSSEKPTETTAVTTVSTTTTTSELVADTPPPYMYYEGKTYTSLYKAEETLMSTDDKMTERLNGYEFVGNTHEFFNIGDMKSDFDVTSLPDNAKVYHDPDKADDSDPFIIAFEENGQTTLYYMNLLSE